jgi:hypothetical protein
MIAVLELIVVTLILAVDTWLLVLAIKAEERTTGKPMLRLPFRGKTKRL